MLYYLHNLLHISDRKVPCLGQFDKFWVCQNDQIDNYPISKLALKAITTFDNASLP